MKVHELLTNTSKVANLICAEYMIKLLIRKRNDLKFKQKLFLALNRARNLSFLGEVGARKWLTDRDFQKKVSCELCAWECSRNGKAVSRWKLEIFFFRHVMSLLIGRFSLKF